MKSYWRCNPGTCFAKEQDLNDPNVHIDYGIDFSLGRKSQEYKWNELLDSIGDYKDGKKPDE